LFLHVQNQLAVDTILKDFLPALSFNGKNLHKFHKLNFDISRQIFGFFPAETALKMMNYMIEWMEHFYPLEKEQIFELLSISGLLLQQKNYPVGWPILQRVKEQAAIGFGKDHPFHYLIQQMELEFQKLK
jgi:hypothetical protein